MCKITVLALVIVVVRTTSSQFAYPGFGSNQNVRNQAGFQQPGFAFPQSDFVFPNFLPQQQFSAHQYQRPHNNNNYGQQARPSNPNNFGQQGNRPKPTFAQKFTTVRTPPLSFASQLDAGANRLDDERISQKSKKYIFLN